MTSVLILGAGVMQEPAIRIASRKGWRVTLADGNPQATARALADQFECVDLKDRDGLLDLARRVRASSGLDGVFTAGTDFSSSVAWVAEHLGLPGISFATAMRATDKCLMRQAFASAGVPSPLSVCWDGSGEPAPLPSMSFPLVVKPVDNMGARGVRRVDEPGPLRAACREALALSRSSRVIVEEYMEGPELSLDAVVYKGKVTVCGVADRLIRFPPHFVEMGHTMPTALPPETVRAIEAVFEAGIHAIGIDNGAAKGDIKLTPQGPMVGEIAARLSGGYMSGWTFPLASGVEVTEAALNVAVGLPPGDLSPRWRKVCAERALISIPGVAREVGGMSEAAASDGVTNVFMRVAPGDRVVFPTNNVQKCANVLAVAAEREEAAQAASRSLARLQVRLQPLEDSTEAWLASDDGHPCFASIPAEVARRIDSLPRWVGSPSAARLDVPVQILSAPEAEQCGVADWHGWPLGESVRLACQRGNAVLVRATDAPSFALGRLFWRSIVRGGHQAGVYVLDSLREAQRTGTLAAWLGHP